MFRPEMLRPMGLPEDVQVIAGGLSLERPTMIKYVPHPCFGRATPNRPHRRSAPLALLPCWLTKQVERSCVLQNAASQTLPDT